ncbi:MAG: xanthine dehydrogenase accessory protein XdhC [Rhizobiaceae bacterium]
MYKDRHDIREFAKSAGPFSLVEVKSIHGSTPRDEGTWMLVGFDNIFRTIGGGQLEKMAIGEARNLLNAVKPEALEIRIPLGPHIGQCCGGTVNLQISVLDQVALESRMDLIEKEMRELPKIFIFGAGHVGKALARALSLLPVHPILVDTRIEEIKSAPEGIEALLTALPEDVVRRAEPGSAFVILTHDHSLDFLIAREAISRHDTTYVGMIGSKTKRATFRNWLRRENGSEAGMERLVCPIGNPDIRDKRPEVIAAMATAEIVGAMHEKAAVGSLENQDLDCKQASGGRG